MILACEISGCDPNIVCGRSPNSECHCYFDSKLYERCPEFQCSDHRKYGPNCDQTCPCPGARCHHNGTCSRCFKAYSGPKCEICACQNGGTCKGAMCLCNRYFKGKLCEVSKCENGGSFNGENCTCPENYDGFL